MILAAVGKNATGKDYFLEYIAKKYDIVMYSVGDIVRELAVKEGVPATRDNLHMLSNKYMTKYGQTFFPDQLIAKIKETGIKNVLISGIRPLSDVLAFKKAFGEEFILVNIKVSDDKTRFERMQVRASARDPQTYEKFLEYDQGEEKLFQTSETEKLSDFVVLNDEGPEEFHAAIDKFFVENIQTKLEK